MVKRNVIVLCVLACFCAFSTGVYAQPAVQTTVPAEEPVLSTNIPPNYAITATSGAMMWAEVDGKSIDTAVSKLDVGVEVPFVTVGYKLRHYEWRNVENGRLGIAGTDPWGDLHKLSLDIADTRIIYNEQWGYTARLGIASGFEKEMSDSFEYEGEAGLAYEYDENLLIEAGAIYHWDETNDWVIPMARISYRAYAEEGLSIVLGMVNTYPEANVEYKFDNGIGVKASWSIENEVYRLGNRNDYQGRGYIKTWDQVLSLESSYQLTDNVKFMGGITFNVDRDYRRYDSGGAEVHRNYIDDAIGMTGGIYVNF